jgi:hypothetical protein
VLSSPRQHSFVPDGGRAKLIFGLGRTTKCHSLFRTAAADTLPKRPLNFMVLVVARPCETTSLDEDISISLRHIDRRVRRKLPFNNMYVMILLLEEACSSYGTLR